MDTSPSTRDRLEAAVLLARDRAAGAGEGERAAAAALLAYCLIVRAGYRGERAGGGWGLAGGLLVLAGAAALWRLGGGAMALALLPLAPALIGVARWRRRRRWLAGALAACAEELGAPLEPLLPAIRAAALAGRRHAQGALGGRDPRLITLARALPALLAAPRRAPLRRPPWPLLGGALVALGGCGALGYGAYRLFAALFGWMARVLFAG